MENFEENVHFKQNYMKTCELIPLFCGKLHSRLKHKKRKIFRSYPGRGLVGTYVR